MNDMLRVMRFNALLLALMMAMATVFCRVVEAQPTTTYDEVFRFNKGYSSWNIDSVTAYLTDGDTIMATMTPQMASATAMTDDSLTYIVLVNSQTIGKTVNPSLMCCLWVSTLDEAICEVRRITHLVHAVDTARQSLGAVATVDTAAIGRSVWDNDIVALANRTATATSAAGVGPDTLTLYVKHSTDSSPVAGVTVWAYPNDGGTPLKNKSDGNGRLQFGANNDTLYNFAWVSGWNQDTIPETTIVTSGIADTLWMTQTVASASPSPALTPVTFNFRDIAGDSVANIELQYKLWTKSGQIVHMDSASVIDPSLFDRASSARTDASGQVTVNLISTDSLLVQGNQTGKVWYLFQAYSPVTGEPLLGADGLKLKVCASATSKVWPSDAACFTE